MNRTISSALRGSVVEEEVELSTVELCRAGQASAQQVEVWVYEGVLQPAGESRDQWRFGGDSLARIRLATRLMRDLEINTPGVALALDLLDRIAADDAFDMDRDELERAMDPIRFVGRAPEQVDEFLAEVVEPLLAEAGADEPTREEVRV